VLSGGTMFPRTPSVAAGPFRSANPSRREGEKHWFPFTGLYRDFRNVIPDERSEIRNPGGSASPVGFDAK